MSTLIFLFRKVIRNYDRNMYIKGTPYGSKKLIAYFVLLFVLLLISLKVDFLISCVVVVVLLLSLIYFYFLLKKQGLFIHITDFYIDEKKHSVVDHLRFDLVQESARIAFYEKTPGVYWTHSKVSLFPYDRCVHFKVVRDILQSKNTKNNDVLVLGGGAESVPCVTAILRNVRKVDSVEINTKISEIGANYFLPLIKNTDSAKIFQINSDAFDFVKESKSKYDFIFIDLFIDGRLPKQLFSKAFLNGLHRILKKDGIIFFNFAAEIDNVRKNMQKLYSSFPNFCLYKHNKHYLVYYIGINMDNKFQDYNKVI